MENEILSYIEMCQREQTSLQRGMNFRLRGHLSIILMSIRPNAPYRDEVSQDGTILIYEGHDASRNDGILDVKKIDQPEFTSMGTLTQNGKFHRAAQQYKKGLEPAEKVKVYEKIRDGIWSYNGLFELVDSWTLFDGIRKVFKFKLSLLDENDPAIQIPHLGEPSRIIPSSVKQEVWKRDGGKCAICGAKTELHFDHIIPYSKGGSSLTPDNIQLLCIRHNLAKHDRIE